MILLSPIDNAINQARLLASQVPVALSQGKDHQTGRVFDFVPASELQRVALMVLPQVGLVLRARDGSVSEWGLSRTYRLTHTAYGESDEWVTVTPLNRSVRPDLAVAWARTHSLASVLRDLMWIGGSEDRDPCEGPQKPVEESRTQAQVREDERRAKNGAHLPDRNEREGHPQTRANSAAESGAWIKCGDRPSWMKSEKVSPPDSEPMKPEDLPVYPPRGATEPATLHPPRLTCEEARLNGWHRMDEPRPGGGSRFTYPADSESPTKNEAPRTEKVPAVSTSPAAVTQQDSSPASTAAAVEVRNDGSESAPTEPTVGSAAHSQEGSTGLNLRADPEDSPEEVFPPSPSSGEGLTQPTPEQVAVVAQVATSVLGATSKRKKKGTGQGRSSPRPACPTCGKRGVANANGCKGCLAAAEKVAHAKSGEVTT